METMFKKATVGEIVAENYKTAAVFSKHKIDFCCKGDRTLEQVCEKKSVDYSTLVNELNEVIKDKSSGEDFNTWPLDQLSDYIVRTYHEYIREKIPPLTQFLTKVDKVHGDGHPELHEILAIFLESAEDLQIHLRKEEMILFPFIKQMTQAKNNAQPLPTPPFGSVENPIEMMKDDHSIEGDRFRKISELSNNYTPPEGACNTYKVSLAMLQEFEEKLHEHIHLENNILFPKAIQLESTF